MRSRSPAARDAICENGLNSSTAPLGHQRPTPGTIDVIASSPILAAGDELHWPFLRSLPTAYACLHVMHSTPHLAALTAPRGPRHGAAHGASVSATILDPNSMKQQQPSTSLCQLSTHSTAALPCGPHGRRAKLSRGRPWCQARGSPRSSLIRSFRSSNASSARAFAFKPGVPPPRLQTRSTRS